jgi:nucleotide-binding universal stress UspA family protein
MARFKNILLVVERNWHREHYQWALTLAARENARLTVMDVVEEMVRPARTSSQHLRNLEKSVLRKRRVRLKELIAIHNKGVRVGVKVKFGNPTTETMGQVLRSRHDLVMLAPEVNGRLNQTLTGRTTMQLLRKCPCPVWIMQSRSLEPSRIMAAVDPDVKSLSGRRPGIRYVQFAIALADQGCGDLQYSCVKHISKRVEHVRIHSSHDSRWFK